jgi:hypothetical protein
MRVAVLVMLVGCGRINFATVTGDGATGDLGDGPAVAVGEAYYPMESITPVSTTQRQVDDASGHGHGGGCAEISPSLTLLQQCPVVVAGKHGNGLRFDGLDDNVEVPSTAELVLPGGFTVATWLWLDSAPAGRVCATSKQLHSGSADKSWTLCVEPDQTLTFDSVGQGGLDHLTTTAILPTAGWHHAAIRWDGATKATFLDGQVVASATVATIDFDDQPIHIGADADTLQAVRWFPGMLDDLSIYGRPLLDVEVAELAR